MRPMRHAGHLLQKHAVTAKYAQAPNERARSRPRHHTRSVQTHARKYLKSLLDKIARLCVAESGWKRGIVAPDSTGLLTDRCETVELKMKKTRKRIIIEYHGIAILDCNIILAAKVTSKYAGDSPTFRQLFEPLSQMEGSVLDGGKGYDSDADCRLAYGKLMEPNIKQRETEGANRGLRFR